MFISNNLPSTIPFASFKVENIIDIAHVQSIYSKSVFYAFLDIFQG